MAKATQDAVQGKNLKMKLGHALAELGKAAFEQHGEGSGPEELIRPIANAKSRADQLATEIAQLSTAPAGQILTPKRIVVGGVVVAGLVVAVLAGQFSTNGKKDMASNRNGVSNARTASEKIADRNESWSLEKIVDFPQPYEGNGNVILLPNNTYAYCASEFHLRLCDLATNKELIIVNNLEPPSYGIRYSESARCILWNTALFPKDGATLFAWNCQTRKVQARLQVQPPGAPSPCQTEGIYSPDQKLIATASSENGGFTPPVRIWNATTLETLYETQGRRPVAFSPDGSLLAFGEDKLEYPGCLLWNYRADKKPVILRRPDNKFKYMKVTALAFIPHTPLLAVVMNDTSLVELWNCDTLRIDSVLKSTKKIAMIAASSDGRLLVTGGDDVRVWHLPSDGRTAILGGLKAKLFTSVSISEDGTRIAAASFDKQVAFWSRRSDGTGQFTFDAEMNHSQSDEEASGNSSVKRTKPSEAIKIESWGLVEAYESNEVAADERYKGKVLEVSGVVNAVKKDILDTMYIELKGGGEFELRGVQCYFDDSHTNSLSNLSKGQWVTIRGRCDGLMMNVLLKECEITK